MKLEQLKSLSRFGRVAFVLALAVATTALPGRAADPPPIGMPLIPEVSSDKKLSVTTGAGVMIVGKVSIEKVTVQTTEGAVEKEVMVVKKLYERGGEKEKYLAAKFVPSRAGKPTLIAVSEKTVYAMDGESGDLLWTVRHDVKADKAKIDFKSKDEMKIALGDKEMRFNPRTGKELKD